MALLCPSPSNEIVSRHCKFSSVRGGGEKSPQLGTADLVSLSSKMWKLRLREEKGYPFPGSHLTLASLSRCLSPRGIQFSLHSTLQDTQGLNEPLSPAVLSMPLWDPRREGVLRQHTPQVEDCLRHLHSSRKRAGLTCVCFVGMIYEVLFKKSSLYSSPLGWNISWGAKTHSFIITLELPLCHSPLSLPWQPKEELEEFISLFWFESWLCSLIALCPWDTYLMLLNRFLHLKSGSVVKLKEIMVLIAHLLSIYFKRRLPIQCERPTDGKWQKGEW